jgi:hypothetical protein
MDSLETLTAFLGWCTILNLAFMVFTALLVMVAGSTLAQIHSKMFGVSEGELPRIYFKYLAYYQMAIVVLNLMPYIALKILA